MKRVLCVSSPMIDGLTGRSLQARDCEGMHRRWDASIVIRLRERAHRNSASTKLELQCSWRRAHTTEISETQHQEISIWVFEFAQEKCRKIK